MDTSDRNYVDGEWTTASSGELIEIRNPAATTEVVGHVQSSTAADAEAAVDAANAAEDEWASTPGHERGRVLNEAGTRPEDRMVEATETLVREGGKTYDEANGEVQRAVDIFYYYAQKASDVGGVKKAAGGERSNLYTTREPLGTVGLITPWNYSGSDFRRFAMEIGMSPNVSS